MSALAATLAMVSASGAALLVLLLFMGPLQAPFLVPKFAALELTAALGFIAFALARATAGGPRWHRPVAVGAWLVLATTLAAWIAATQTAPGGTPYATAAFARWAALFGLACGTSALDDGDRQRALESVAMAAAAVACVGLVQHLEVVSLPIPVFSTPGSTFGNRNIAAEAIAMALPLGLAAALGSTRPGVRRAIFASLVVDLAYLAVTRARGAWLGAACGLAAALWLARLRWSRAAYALAAGTVGLAMIAAALPGRYNSRDSGDQKRYSAVIDVLEGGFDSESTALKTRLGLWKRTLTMVRDRPLLGVGPGNWPVVFPRYAEPMAARDGVLSASLAPRQAHDDVLERSAETGIAGLAALVWLAIAAGMAARVGLTNVDERSRAVAAGAAGALVALVASSLAGFPLEMPGTIALAGIALGLVAARRDLLRSAPTRPEARAYAAAAVGLALLSFAAVRAERSVRASRWLGKAERTMQRDAGPEAAAEALVALRLALQADPGDFRARLRTSQMLLRLGKTTEAISAAQDALDIEPSDPNALATLAAAELASGDLPAARRDADRAIATLQDFPYALYVRANAADRAGDQAAATADRDRIADLALSSWDKATARTANELLRATRAPAQ